MTMMVKHNIVVSFYSSISCEKFHLLLCFRYSLMQIFLIISLWSQNISVIEKLNCAIIGFSWNFNTIPWQFVAILYFDKLAVIFMTCMISFIHYCICLHTCDRYIWTFMLTIFPFQICLFKMMLSQRKMNEKCKEKCNPSLHQVLSISNEQC